MKTQKPFNQFELRADALDYLFVEWLVRNHLYRKFAKNLVGSRNSTTSARELIRRRVRLYAKFPVVDYTFLISGAFFFEFTPEGREFWNDVSRRWSDFCGYFFPLLTQPR
jgi:hypothetical protein